MERTATRSESLLRPREIQVRIRSGQSPETVAAAAQTTVDRVMAFATPVLAERAFVAQQAAKSSVRRRAGDGPVGLLGEAVARRLESAGLDPEAADWDAWRREDGRWTVVASYVETGEDQQAEFTYDAIGRYVIAEDDLARWLVGERRATEPANPSPSPAAPVVQTAAGQLALGDDALQVVTGRPLSAVPRPAVADEPADLHDHRPALPPAELPAEPPSELPAELLVGPADSTEDLTETARAVRAAGARAPVPAPAPAPEPGSAAVPAPEPAAEGEVLFEDTGLRSPPEPVAERRPARQAAASRTRRSMPSWDDIMLGSAPRGD